LAQSINFGTQQRGYTISDIRVLVCASQVALFTFWPIVIIGVLYSVDRSVCPLVTNVYSGKLVRDAVLDGGSGWPKERSLRCGVQIHGKGKFGGNMGHNVIYRENAASAMQKRPIKLQFCDGEWDRNNKSRSGWACALAYTVELLGTAIIQVGLP